MRKGLTLVMITAVLALAACGPEQEAGPTAAASPPPAGTTAPATPGPSSEGPATPGPAGGGGSLELAKKYAPLVRMGQGEKNLPIDALVFVDNSRLEWNREGCDEDEVIDPDPTPQKLADPASYRARKTQLDTECQGREGDEYNTTQRTRPFANKDTLGKEGYFLNAWNGLHGAGSVKDDTKTPAYVEYIQGTDANQGKTAYVYWFFYPYNTWTNPTPKAKGKGGNHEGDWERITVVVGTDGRPEGVVFSQHETKCRMEWGKVAGKDGHPVAYSATGTHGSYPIGDARYKIESLPAALKALGMLEDQTSSKGESWKTWLNLKEVQREPWWGYAGGWGEVGGPIGAFELDKHQTGPEGPNPIKHEQQMIKEAFTRDSCPDPVSRDQPADDKQAAIERLEYCLHALGRHDAGNACSIAEPKIRPLCLFALPRAFEESTEQEDKVLRTIKIDPAKVRKVSDKRYEFPPESLRGKTTVDATLVMIKIKKQWYLTDEQGAR